MQFKIAHRLLRTIYQAGFIIAVLGAFILFYSIKQTTYIEAMLLTLATIIIVRLWFWRHGKLGPSEKFIHITK